MPSLLNVQNLSVEYRREQETVYAVRGLSLSMDEGEVLGLVGETGAGKTTLAKSIMGILPERNSAVTQGEIFFEGTNLRTISQEDYRGIRGKQISMIFQNPMTALNPLMPVGEQVAEAIRLHGKLGKKEAEEKARQMLSDVGIQRDRYWDYPWQFSGGMKQRVVIAIALSCHPRLLLADEPTTALDVTIQAQVLSMIRKLKEQLGTSILMITHDLGIVAEMCDRVAVIYAGEIVEIGTLEDIFDSPLHPYTKGLFASIPRIGNRKQKIQPIAGNVPDPTVIPEGCAFAPRCPFAGTGCLREKIELHEETEGHRVRCIRAEAGGQADE